MRLKKIDWMASSMGLLSHRLMLDIGCGDKKKQGAIGLDIKKKATVDIVADARMLPFQEGCFDHVYSSHVIEHFSHKEVRAVINEWIRVLKKRGTVEIRCPDLRARALLFFLSPTWKNVQNIYGSQNFEGNYHRCGFSYGLLKNLLEQQGIGNVKRIIKGYKGLPFIPDCLHIQGTKL